MHGVFFVCLTALTFDEWDKMGALHSLGNGNGYGRRVPLVNLKQICCVVYFELVEKGELLETVFICFPLSECKIQSVAFGKLSDAEVTEINPNRDVVTFFSFFFKFNFIVSVNGFYKPN